MGCEFSGHHLNNQHNSKGNLGSTRPKSPRGNSTSSYCNSSSSVSKIVGGSISSVASHSSTERRGSLLLSSRRSLTRQRTTEQVEHAAVVKRQPLNEYFSEFEKDVLISTWEALLLYTHEHGAFIFRLAAEMCPELKAAYNVEFNDDDELVVSSCALQYSQTYITLIDEAIRSLEDPQEGFYDSVLIAGASHATIPQMKPEFFKVLKRATLTTWEGLLGEEFTEDVANSWQTLLDYVVAVMVEGNRVYLEEERRCNLVATPEVDEVEDRLSLRADVQLGD
ncbi:unnamed protein product [Rodentolepis nana]|uniref:GLOBIN domain-containing protein n=1 Tax=Rodentolepis nana TaxID=102285 RepID=A0A158QGQ9_RODNA|nr:unnamed protein product [Rodentolepis nana]